MESGLRRDLHRQCNAGPGSKCLADAFAHAGSECVDDDLAYVGSNYVADTETDLVADSDGNADTSANGNADTDTGANRDADTDSDAWRRRRLLKAAIECCAEWLNRYAQNGAKRKLVAPRSSTAALTASTETHNARAACRPQRLTRHFASKRHSTILRKTCRIFSNKRGLGAESLLDASFDPGRFHLCACRLRWLERNVALAVRRAVTTRGLSDFGDDDRADGGERRSDRAGSRHIASASAGRRRQHNGKSEVFALHFCRPADGNRHR